MTELRHHSFEIFLATGMVMGAVAIGSIWGWHNALAFLAGGALGAPFAIRRWRPLRRPEK
jgi:predicted MFS family arabinose efflux permease